MRVGIYKDYILQALLIEFARQLSDYNDNYLLFLTVKRLAYIHGQQLVVNFKPLSVNASDRKTGSLTLTTFYTKKPEGKFILKNTNSLLLHFFILLPDPSVQKSTENVWL